MSKPTTGDFTKTAGWLDWYAGPAQPRFTLPAGAVDAHCHVFGPGAEFPYAPERTYTKGFPRRSANNAPCGMPAVATPATTLKSPKLAACSTKQSTKKLRTAG